MIKIRAQAKQYKDMMTAAIKAEGHADYAADGPDIVCAAVSTLLQTFKAYCEESNMEIDVESFKAGDLKMSASGKTAEISRPFAMMVIGLEMVAENYPENVEFMWGEKQK